MWLSCDHMIRGKLWMMSTHFKSPPWQVWWLQASCKRRYFVFSLSRDLMWLRGERDTWHYGGVSLVISEYHANFDGHRPFGRGEIKLSICHVTSQNCGARRSCDIMGELTLSQVAPLLSLVVTGLWNRRYKAFNLPHDLTWLAMGQFPSSEATNLSGFMAVGLT